MASPDPRDSSGPSPDLAPEAPWVKQGREHPKSQRCCWCPGEEHTICLQEMLRTFPPRADPTGRVVCLCPGCINTPKTPNLLQQPHELLPPPFSSLTNPGWCSLLRGSALPKAAEVCAVDLVGDVKWKCDWCDNVFHPPAIPNAASAWCCATLAPAIPLGLSLQS